MVFAGHSRGHLLFSFFGLLHVVIAISLRYAVDIA